MKIPVPVVAVVLLLLLQSKAAGQGAESIIEPVQGPIFERLVERRFNELQQQNEQAFYSLADRLDKLRIGEMISEVRASTEANREFQQELKAVGGARGLIGEFQRGRAEIIAAKAELAKANAELAKVSSSLGPLARLGQNFLYLCLFLGGGLLFLLFVLLVGLYVIRSQLNRLTGAVSQAI
jgi:hypothetical protein